MEKSTASASSYLNGLPASPGIAIGPPLLVTHRDLEIPSGRIDESDVSGQAGKAAEVLKRVREQLDELQQTQTDPEVLNILEAQMEIVDDPELAKRVRQLIEEDYRSAEYALYTAFNEFIQLLRQTGQEWIRDRIVDLQSLRNRLIQQSGGLDAQPRQSSGAVLFAEELSPTEVIEYSEAGVAAIVMQHGGTTSHAVIISQALNIPCIVGTEWRRTQLDGVNRVAVDARSGEVVLNPDPDILEMFRQRAEKQSREREEALKIGAAPSRTECGVEFQLQANMEFEQELAGIREYRAEGIGLLRTETLFLRQGYYDSERHAALYQHILSETNGYTVTIRLLDIGGDKLPGREFEEANPFLGWRGIRMLLDEKELLRRQVSTILKVASESPGRIRILLPMVSDISELREFRHRLREVQKELEKEGVECSERIPVGIMIEVPAMALMAEEAAREADFFSIGSNDLTQYVLASDRGNERVSRLYSPSHPAVWKLIHHACTAAIQAGIPVSVCGEIAGNPVLAGALLGMGVRELSMNPSSIPAVKKLLCSHELATFRSLFQSLISISDREEVDRLLENWSQANL